MRRDLARALRLLLPPTLALGVVVAFVPGRAGLAVRVYALFVCAVVLGYSVDALRAAYPRARPLRPRGAPAGRTRRRPPSLAQLENQTALAVAGAFDLHHRLRPRLRALAEGLLLSRRRLSLDDDAPAARDALGDTTWELVRRDRPPPEDRLGRGLPLSELRSVVESLERT